MISVVIPTFRHQARLRDLLSSLERQVVSVPFEVIVVANLPEVGLKKTVESYGSSFRFHETGRIGVNIARNKGLSLSRGSIVLFLDDDTYVGDRRFLENHLITHELHPEACAIGGGYLPRAGLSSVESAYHWILQHSLTSNLLERNEATRLFAGNVSFKSSMLEDFRFDDRILFGSSEASLFSELRRARNLFLMFESLSVEHRISVSFFDLARRAFYQGYGAGLLAPKALPERPHWNSRIPLEETIRLAHVDQSRLFELAIRTYRRFYKYGSELGVADSSPYFESANSKKVTYRRPEFSPPKWLAAFSGVQWRGRLIAKLKESRSAIRSAIQIS